MKYHHLLDSATQAYNLKTMLTFESFLNLFYILKLFKKNFEIKILEVEMKVLFYMFLLMINLYFMENITWF